MHGEGWERVCSALGRFKPLPWPQLQQRPGFLHTGLPQVLSVSSTLVSTFLGNSAHRVAITPSLIVSSFPPPAPLPLITACSLAPSQVSANIWNDFSIVLDLSLKNHKELREALFPLVSKPTQFQTYSLLVLLTHVYLTHQRPFSSSSSVFSLV